VEFTEGLNLIKGRNSAGKSTLLNALLFALYGKIPDIPPKLLVSRLPGRGEMSVYVRFRSPATGAVVEVYRSGSLDRKGDFRTSKLMLKENGKMLSVESDEDLKKKVTERMGVTPKKFANLVYVRQGRLQEILEPPRRDMDLILRLTVARELKEQVDEARKVLEKYEGKDVQTELQNIQDIILPQLQSNIEELEKDVESLQRDLAELDELIKKAESPTLLELLKNIEAKERIELELNRVSSAIQTLFSQANVASREELLNRITDAERRREELNGQYAKLLEEFNNLQKEWSASSGRANALQEEIQRHERLLREGVATCPACGQDLKAEVLEGILEGKRKALADLLKTVEKRRKAYEDKSAELEKLRNELNSTLNEAKRLKNLDENIQKHLAKRGELEKDIVNMKTSIKTLLKRLNLPFEPKDPELKVKIAQQLPLEPVQLEAKKKEALTKKEKLTAKSSDLAKKKGELQTYQFRISELEKRLKAADLARKLSERLEMAIETRRSKVLQRIEAKALSYYERMTDQRDYDSIKIDPETYAVSVHPRNLTEHIPATRDGGGHQTLLALALRLALLEELGFRNLLILDEPTYGVDSENLPQLAGYIEDASKNLAQTILVTHHDICEEEASNIIEVSRDESGLSHAGIKKL
jgi:exonuclease SbcC